MDYDKCSKLNKKSKGLKRKCSELSQNNHIDTWRDLVSTQKKLSSSQIIEKDVIANNHEDDIALDLIDCVPESELDLIDCSQSSQQMVLSGSTLATGCNSQGEIELDDGSDVGVSNDQFDEQVLTQYCLDERSSPETVCYRDDPFSHDVQYDSDVDEPGNDLYSSSKLYLVDDFPSPVKLNPEKEDGQTTVSNKTMLVSLFDRLIKKLSKKNKASRKLNDFTKMALEQLFKMKQSNLFFLQKECQLIKSNLMGASMKFVIDSFYEEFGNLFVSATVCEVSMPCDTGATTKDPQSSQYSGINQLLPCRSKVLLFYTSPALFCNGKTPQPDAVLLLFPEWRIFPVRSNGSTFRHLKHLDYYILNAFNVEVETTNVLPLATISQDIGN